MRFSKYTSPLLDRYSSAAVCALIVMPRSRSSSIESSTCSAISRSASPPHIWMKRSASVDLPWSMCAMMEKFRMRERSVNAWPCKRSAILAQLGNRCRGEAVLENGVLQDKDGNITAIAHAKVGIGVHIDLVEIDAQRAQPGCHLLAEMAAVPAVQLSLCQSGPRW